MFHYSRDALGSMQVKNDNDNQITYWHHLGIDEGDVDKNDNNIKSCKATKSACGQPEAITTDVFDRFPDYSIAKHVDQQVHSYFPKNLEKLESTKRLTPMTETKTNDKIIADKKFTKKSGIMDTDVENIPFRNYELALSELGMELFLKLVRKAVSRAEARKQFKSKVIGKSSARKIGLWNSDISSMLSHIRHLTKTTNQLLKCNRKALASMRLMDGDSKYMNHVEEKFCDYDDRLVFETPPYQSAFNNDEIFWKHTESVESFKELLSDDGLIEDDGIMNLETRSKAFVQSHEDLADESVNESIEANYLQPDFDLRMHHQTLSLSTIANRALERQRSTFSRGSYRRSLHQGKYRYDERANANDLSFGEHFATSPDRNYRRHLARTKSGLDEREMTNGGNRLDWKEREENVLTAVYGWNDRLSEQWTDNARCEYHSKSLDDVGGFTFLNRSNKFRHVQQPNTINRTDSSADNFDPICKLGLGGTPYFFQNFALDDGKLKPLQTYNPLQKSSHCDSVLSHGEILDNAELMCDSFESDLKIC